MPIIIPDPGPVTGPLERGTERIIINRSATLSHVFYVNGVAADPTGTPTVQILRSDGTTVTTGTVTDDPAAGTWTVTIPATANTLLDTLEVTWTATVSGETQEYVDYVDVAGGYLFSIAQARALPPLSNTTTYTTARIAEARVLAEQTIEDACGRAFVPRYTRETLHGTGTQTLMLSMPDIRAVRSVAITTGTSASGYTADELALLAVNPSGLLHNNGAAWTAGVGNITVGYEHGLGTPPARVSQAALLLARSWLVKGPVDDRALGQATAGGDFSFGLATPGRGGSYVGIPEVDATIDAYSLRVGVA